MMAALWLVVAIASVTMYFSIDAKERRQLGIDAAERGRARAAALGALAMTQARLEAVLRQVGGANPLTANMRSSDPWLGIDSIFGGTMYVDSVEVDVRFNDPATQMHLNNASEMQLRTFFQFVLRDIQLGEEIAQSIIDWRDPDTLARANGAEQQDYIKKQRLVLPSNVPFRDVEELLHVNAVTPEIYAQVAPYLTVRGTGQININTAPEPVLRTLPGITDDVVARILALRSQGRRINSLNEVFAGMQQPGGGRGGGPPPQQSRMQGMTTVQTSLVEVLITARAGQQALPSRLSAEVTRNNTSTAVTVRRW
jgi:type II secretory pathway component PulK